MDHATAASIHSGNASLQIRTQQVWERENGRLRCEVPLHNSLGSSLKLICQIMASSPHKVVFLIHDGSRRASNAARLCVRGSHGNKRGDLRVWNAASHLHLWRQRHGDSLAVDPHDPPWPPPGWVDGSTTPITPSELKSIFQSFCQMLHIECNIDTFWSDPDVAQESSVLVLLDGEEIP